ncbi:MAG: hypothetical protein HC796_00115 [Synechococcaceae cyanobacterium RL_1_2]|nr:hypothetical protein [Synechococcaceae cyanobacterium RL_1_2]
MLALLFNSAPICSNLIPLLESKNYEVQVGETWLECWQLYQQALPELILVMPEETLLDELAQLLKQIRSYPAGGTNAVIVAFALAKNLALVETLIPQGLDDFVLLPWYDQSFGLKLNLYHKLYCDRAPLQRVVNNLLTEDNNQNLLSAKADTHSSDEYIILDRQLKVITCSPNADRFSDEQQPIEPGEPIQDYFPELFGVEDILHSVCDGKQIIYRLPGIARSLERPNDLYVDLEITPQPHPQDQTPGLLMVLRDTSQLMELKQIVMQRSNESQLLLRQLTINQTYLDRVIKFPWPMPSLSRPQRASLKPPTQR